LFNVQGIYLEIGTNSIHLEFGLFTVCIRLCY